MVLLLKVDIRLLLKTLVLYLIKIKKSFAVAVCCLMFLFQTTQTWAIAKTHRVTAGVHEAEWVGVSPADMLQIKPPLCLWYMMVWPFFQALHEQHLWGHILFLCNLSALSSALTSEILVHPAQSVSHGVHLMALRFHTWDLVEYHGNCHILKWWMLQALFFFFPVVFWNC